MHSAENPSSDGNAATPPNPAATPSDPAANPPASTVTEADMRAAFGAFRKRLKAMQLETDSRLGRSPLTGKKETVTAIQLPPGHSKETWQKLVDAGYLKYDGRGFYLLLKPNWG